MLVLSHHVDNLKPRLAADMCNVLFDFGVFLLCISVDLLPLITVVLQLELKARVIDDVSRRLEWQTYSHHL